MGKDCRVKQRTQTHRKRKGFMGNLNKSVKIYSASDNVSIELPTINLNAANSTCVLEQNNENSSNLSASSRKVEDLEDTLILKPCISGYRIIDVAVLVSVFSSFLCPECGSPTLSLGERYNKRHGLSSLLYLKCQKKDCNYLHQFYTSFNKNNKKFKKNKKKITKITKIIKKDLTLISE